MSPRIFPRRRYAADDGYEIWGGDLHPSRMFGRLCYIFHAAISFDKVEMDLANSLVSDCFVSYYTYVPIYDSSNSLTTTSVHKHVSQLL